ncbi:hypothetical protein E1286_38705 [Nonomuraea terrae]|uniref:Uncharacterized protein n=1 Tax=Nonomuraea terrae TaxID=2530383 RepID=A0A4R4XXN3_9ACTN|nr:hypothetical protein [Nonomuraea terrae]TDD36100.1 hypothetical protein E1286_38705 [Nonomuraea terrae]
MQKEPKHGKVGGDTTRPLAKEMPPTMARSTTAATARKALVKQAERQAASRPRTKSRQDKPTLAVRISPQTNERLTYANEQTGLGISGIVETALVDYLDFLGIPADAEPPRNPDGSRPKRERSVKRRTRRAAEEVDDVPIGPRITRQTDDRLTIACLDTATGPQDIVETALKAWLRKQGIPLYPKTPGQR